MSNSSVYLNSRSSLSWVIIFMEHFTVKLSSSNSYFNSSYLLENMLFVLWLCCCHCWFSFFLSFIFSSSSSCTTLLKGTYCLWLWCTFSTKSWYLRSRVWLKCILFNLKLTFQLYSIHEYGTWKSLGNESPFFYFNNDHKYTNGFYYSIKGEIKNKVKK